MNYFFTASMLVHRCWWQILETNIHKTTVRHQHHCHQQSTRLKLHPWYWYWDLSCIQLIPAFKEKRLLCLKVMLVWLYNFHSINDGNVPPAISFQANYNVKTWRLKRRFIYRFYIRKANETFVLPYKSNIYCRFSALWSFKYWNFPSKRDIPPFHT